MENKTPILIKLVLIGLFFAALVGSFIAFTPLRMFGIIPLLIAIVFAFVILIVQHKKGRGLLWPLLILGIATFGLAYGVVTQIVDKPEVAKDVQQEEAIEKAAEEGEDALDDLGDEF